MYSLLTSNIYPNRDPAVIPLGCDDKMDHLIASLAGGELASGPWLTTAQGELIYERMRDEQEGAEELRGSSSSFL